MPEATSVNQSCRMRGAGNAGQQLRKTHQGKEKKKKMKRMMQPLIGVAALVALMALPHTAAAVGTASGTTITNLATLNFTVGGNAQPAVQSNNGVTTDFVVDTALNVNVTTLDAAAVPVNPGQTGNVLTFKVTNLGNAVQDFALTATAVATNSPAKFGGKNDTADMTPASVKVFVDGNNNGVYDPAVDTATFVDNLAADQYATVFIVADAPNTLVNGDVASYHLTATVHSAGAVGALGALATQSATFALNTVDTVFTDAAGTAGDVANDGKHSDQSDYTVRSAVISVNKTASVRDPYGNAAAIPGATVTYTITISNAGTATASAVLTSLTDPLNANLTAVQTAGAASWTVTGSTRAVTTGTLTLDNADANGDGLGISAGTVTYTLGTILAADAVNGYAAGELKPGESVSVTFKATIN